LQGVDQEKAYRAAQSHLKNDINFINNWMRLQSKIIANLEKQIKNEKSLYDEIRKVQVELE